MTSNKAEARANFWQGFGAFLQGAGIFLTGLGAALAIPKTGDAVKEILKVQEQAQKIEIAVQNLQTLMTAQTAKDLVEQTESNRNAKAALNLVPTDKKEASRGQVYLPTKYKSDVEETLSNDNIPRQEKIQMIQKTLQVKE